MPYMGYDYWLLSLSEMRNRYGVFQQHYLTKLCPYCEFIFLVLFSDTGVCDDLLKVSSIRSTLNNKKLDSQTREVIVTIIKFTEN
jgi:hypothetical protein